MVDPTHSVNINLPPARSEKIHQSDSRRHPSAAAEPPKKSFFQKKQKKLNPDGQRLMENNTTPLFDLCLFSNFGPVTLSLGKCFGSKEQSVEYSKVDYRLQSKL